jgi:lipid-binding SYLF domain-containing protein
MRLIKLTLSIALGCALLPGADENDTRKVDERLGDAASLFSEIMTTPDRAIPQRLLDRSECVVLVPGLKKAAFVFGGKYGKGFAECRRRDADGWGPPAAIRIEGGSFGLQVGVSSSDVVLLVTNERGMKKLEQDHFTIGGEAAAAAGPVGRNATAQTDLLMTAELLSWSRSHGIFAGVSLDGSTLRNDLDENNALYAKRWTSRQILESGAPIPPAAKRLLDLLAKYSPRRTR